MRLERGQLGDAVADRLRGLVERFAFRRRERQLDDLLDATLAEHRGHAQVDARVAVLALKVRGRRHDALLIEQDRFDHQRGARGGRVERAAGLEERDDFTPESDVDVLVEFEPGHVPGFFGLFDMEEELSALLGRAADVNTPAGLNKYFRQEVLEEAEVQYAQG